jgi:hypothetical protein
MDRVFRDIDRDAAKQSKGKKASVTERAKYQFVCSARLAPFQWPRQGRSTDQ